MFEDNNDNLRDDLIFRLAHLVEHYPECDWLRDFAEQNGMSNSNSLLSATVNINSLDTESVVFFSEN